MEKIKIDEDFLVGQGQALFNNSKSSRELVQDSWSKEMSAYNNEFSEDERKYSEYLGTKRLFIPKTYTNTQRLVIECIDTFLFDPDEIVSVSSDKSIPMESQDAVKVLINYRLNGHPINFFHECYETALDAIRNKIGILKIYPKLKTKKTKKSYPTQDPDGNDILIDMEEEAIESYTPQMEAIPPEDVFFHKNATWKNYWKFPIIHRYRKTRDELKRMGYKNVDELPSINSNVGDDELSIKRDEPYQVQQSPFSNKSNISEQDDVMVYECWDLLPGDDGYLESYSYVLLGDENRPIVLGRGKEKNELPYKFDDFEYNRPPFIIGLAYPESHQLYGKSYPMITASLQMETNAQRNQEREAVARALRPPVYVNRDAEVDLMALITRRIGGYVQGNGPAGDSITEMPTMNPMAITSAHQARTDADYYETGIPPNLLGTSSGDETATGSTQQLVNANKKISLILKSLAHTLYVPAFRYLFRLEQVYCSDEFINMVTGKMLGWQLPNDQFPARNIIQGDFDFKINLGINKQAQINKMLMIFDRANQANQVTMGMVQAGVVPPQQATFFNTSWLMKQILGISGIKNEGDYSIQAIQPPPQEGQQKGIASQPRNPADASQAINQMSPEATGALNVI